MKKETLSQIFRRFNTQRKQLYATSKLTLKTTKIVIIALSAMSIQSCSTDFMNVSPPNQLSADVVWNDALTAQAYINDIYNGFEQGGFNEQMLASVSDEAMFTHPGRGIDIVNSGASNPTSLGWVHGTWAWGRMYIYIRFCNVAMQQLNSEDNKITDQDLKEKMLGQVHFLRAYYYQQLLRYYGGVPLVDKVYTITDDMNIARNTYEECVNFIVKDCEEAHRFLNGKSMDKGRATALAALALKSRVLLYAASDQHVSTKLKAKVSTISDEMMPILAYNSGNQQERYRAAQAAAKAVMDASSGYKLNLAAPVSAAEGQNNYKSIAMGGGSKAPGIDPSAASELIYAKYFIADANYTHGLHNGPNGYKNWAGNTPIGLLVDDYQMIDGSSFSWNNAAHKAEPYKNRDPRFYATILYDGAGWKPREKISGNIDPANQIQTGTYDILDGGTVKTIPGIDTRGGSIESWNGSWTGYYYHKFIDPDPNIVDANNFQLVPWPFFRYTEAVLNYVEASIELGETTVARDWLNKIRFRAGMPAITTTDQNQLRDIYRHERRIEMAYEEHRYHDVRRWLIAAETVGRKVTYIKITGKFKPGKTMTAPYRHDPTVYDYTYTPVVDNSQENRSWNNNLYFRPLHRDELNKNNLLKQNPGYSE